MAFTRYKSKKQIAQFLEICPRTLANYLNKRYYQEMAEMGYERNQKLLSPRQLNYLAAKIGLEEPLTP